MKLLSVKEVAARYGVSKATVLGWIARGELLAMRFSEPGHGSGRATIRIEASRLVEFEQRAERRGKKVVKK